MPVPVDNRTYYRTSEVCRLVGISRNTLYRWLEHGVLGSFELRDRRGWRLFTEDEIGTLKAENNQTSKINRLKGRMAI